MGKDAHFSHWNEPAGPCDVRFSLFNACVYFWLSWSLLLHGTVVHCGARASHGRVSSSCGAQGLGAQTSVVATRGLNSCGAQAELPCGMPGLTGLGIEPVSPALAGGFLSTVPPGKYSHALKAVTFPNLCRSLHLEGTGGASGLGARISW